MDEQDKKDMRAMVDALVSFQAQLKPAAKSGYNPHFKSNFVTLEDAWDAVRDLLSKNHLSVIQCIDWEPDAKQWVVVTKLRHVAGGLEESRIPIINATTPQAMGSSLSYSKRYAIMAILGIPSEDDDGNAAQAQKQKEALKEPSKPAAKQTGRWSPSEPQLKRLFAICKSAGWNADQLHEYIGSAFGITSSKELDMKQYNETCTFIAENRR